MIEPKPAPMFPEAADLDIAFQQIQHKLDIPSNELFPAIMLYHNTLLKEVMNAQVGDHSTPVARY